MTTRQRGLRAAERQARRLSKRFRTADPAEAEGWRRLAGKVRGLRAGKVAARTCAA